MYSIVVKMTEWSNDGPGSPRLEVIDAVVELLSAASGTARLTVAGASMAPLLCRGDVILVRLGGVRPRLGDVVVRRQSGGLVVHRVVKVDGEHILTKGDASLSPDPPAALDDILGVVIAIEGCLPVDLTRGTWRVVNPVLAVYSHLVGRVWQALSALHRTLLSGWSPLVLRLCRRALRFVLRIPLQLLALGARRI
jgi:signal peptidase I